MTNWKKILFSCPEESFPIVGPNLSAVQYTNIDLSVLNPDLQLTDICDPVLCQAYIDLVLVRNSAKVAYGGYLEERMLYKNFKTFRGGDGFRRNIHLGVDFWCQPQSTVHVPCNGVVHSFADNTGQGNYGPTVVLLHESDYGSFYSLYGHLSKTSLTYIKTGKVYHRGEVLATVGHQQENGGYAPHLHFQLIGDMQGKKGDYPGVCAVSELEGYKKNCPDPNLLLKIQT